MSKKELIVDAAIELITQNGIHNTPMSAIAKKAGTGIGTIYNYFRNKDILINYIYVSIKKEEEYIYNAFDPNMAIKTQFETYFIATIDFFKSEPNYFKFMEQLQASPLITPDSKAEGEKAIKYVGELLNKGKSDRIIKNISNAELLMFIGGTVLSYLRWFFSSNAANTNSISNQVTMLWDAIKD
ncbi:TetR/AcrR family transcriptional regulator [Saccharicrinis aurantiacus]|uniref:TetR/AcrR family transcriptional regulator n=1 Tax=Saccharicrinis aurantiacus TaxID=1849719 RepID=UPI0024923DB6|nr:TetR/AcrR family transcriptional regulator [Saccharicrinis aurantiacus]